MPANGIQFKIVLSTGGKNAKGSNVPDRKEIIVVLSDSNPQAEVV